MDTTEYTDFAKASEALHAATANGSQETAIKTYQRPDDLVWVWAVTTTPRPVELEKAV